MIPKEAQAKDDICECGAKRIGNMILHHKCKKFKPQKKTGITIMSVKEVTPEVIEKEAFKPSQGMTHKEGVTQEEPQEVPQNHSPQEAVNGEGRQVIQPGDKEPKGDKVKAKATCPSGSDDSSLSDKKLRIMNAPKGYGILFYNIIDVKEFVKKEDALLSQLCAGVITWDEFHKERNEILGKELI